jgi:hypothetical protein
MEKSNAAFPTQSVKKGGGFQKSGNLEPIIHHGAIIPTHPREKHFCLNRKMEISFQSQIL